MLDQDQVRRAKQANPLQEGVWDLAVNLSRASLGARDVVLGIETLCPAHLFVRQLHRWMQWLD